MKKKNPRSVEPIEGVVVAETGLLGGRLDNHPAGGHIGLRILNLDAAMVQHHQLAAIGTVYPHIHHTANADTT